MELFRTLLSKFADIDKLEENMEFSKTEAVAYIVILLLVVVAVIYMLYIASSLSCAKCTFEQRMDLVVEYVKSYAYVP
ncbi:MAG: hypothetical protein HY366_02320 [Candidatus Aenigmarchaeota archaeon]|nr:hypothetical protein [Candidatus Aenigmarchaeota archaeon]